LQTSSNDPNADTGGDYEKIAWYHIGNARTVFQEISQKNPELADQMAAFVMQAILAANAYNHDIFERRNPQNEDFETRIRKNR
jgi:hypothetical protein